MLVSKRWWLTQSKAVKKSIWIALKLTDLFIFSQNKVGNILKMFPSIYGQNDYVCVKHMRSALGMKSQVVDLWKHSSSCHKICHKKAIEENGDGTRM